jgi:secreted trypsin-like serine protease
MVRAADGGWIQAGIVSWGRTPYGSDDGCGNPQLYGVYTRVSNYFNWIASHVQG